MTHAKKIQKKHSEIGTLFAPPPPPPEGQPPKLKPHFKYIYHTYTIHIVCTLNCEKKTTQEGPRNKFLNWFSSNSKLN